jgi:hypothetical protein
VCVCVFVLYGYCWFIVVVRLSFVLLLCCLACISTYVRMYVRNMGMHIAQYEVLTTVCLYPHTVKKAK